MRADRAKSLGPSQGTLFWVLWGENSGWCGDETLRGVFESLCMRSGGGCLLMRNQSCCGPVPHVWGECFADPTRVHTRAPEAGRPPQPAAGSSSPKVSQLVSF